MDRFVVEGGVPLRGQVRASGSKNAVLPLMAAAILSEGTTVIEGVPDLMDIRTMAMMLRVLGADVDLLDGVLHLDMSKVNRWLAPYDLVRKMRASFYVLGPLVARFGKAQVSLPGGCALGPRPVDLHLKGLRRLGCEIALQKGYVVAEAKELHGARITLDIASVGATGNIMMTAVAAKGTTVIENAAREPEITELANFLNAMGAQIEGVGMSRIEITGPTPLKPVRWRTIPDRIETATYLFAGAISGGEVEVRNALPEHLTLVLDKMAEAGFELEIGDDWVKVGPAARGISPVDVTTAVYPGFPTDLQPMWTALMCLSQGNAVVTDTIYPERFTHVPELQRLGGQLRQELNSVHIRGVPQLNAAPLMCSDIRGGAALVLAALAAQGTSTILRVYHIDRGYERMEEKLQKLGAKIKRERE